MLCHRLLLLPAILPVLVCSAPLAMAGEGRSVAIILDASGSMNSVTTGKQTRIEAAKQALAGVVDKISGETRLSLWAYCHRSPASEKNCNDIGQVVPFGVASANRGEIVSSANSLRALGYTPITKSITLAAESLASEESEERIIVLISDGRETCLGDPCAAAQALAKTHAKLVMHTIGLGVDSATKTQLACIADVTGGKYFDAADSGSLGNALSTAVTTGKAAPPPAAKTTTVVARKWGKLKVTPAADLNVYEAGTDKSMGMVFSHTGAEIELPDGIYNVKFAQGLIWKGIQVKRGEITTVAAGTLKIEPKADGVYKIADIETGEELQQLFGIPSNEQILPPGQYQLNVRGKAAPFTVGAGETTIVPIGIMQLKGPWKGEIFLKGEQGKRLDHFFDNGHGASFGLLPGVYKLEFEGTDYDISVNAGDTAEFKIE